MRTSFNCSEIPAGAGYSSSATVTREVYNVERGVEFSETSSRVAFRICHSERSRRQERAATWGIAEISTWVSQVDINTNRCLSR